MTYTEWMPLNLKSEEIYRSMGIAHRGEHEKTVRSAIERLRRLAAKLATPRSVSVVVAIEVSGKRQIRLANQLPFTCNAKYFAGATHAAVLIATVGSGLEQESDRCFREGRYLEGLIFDACGSTALDQVLGLARQEINDNTAKTGYKLGYTLSPGCQMIPLEEQATIFSLLDFEQVGVGITDSYMMLPAKSISAVIPLGEALSMPNNANYACEVCSQQKNCEYRSRQ